VQGKLGQRVYEASHREAKAHRHRWKYRLYDGSVRPETQAATAVAYKAGMATICLFYSCLLKGSEARQLGTEEE
jgi:hypothetical protein